MEQLLWTFDDVVKFIDHPDRPVRGWALERLTKRFPAQAGEPVVTLLDDDNEHIAFTASEFLSKAGDRETYGPLLLGRLRRSRGHRFGYLSEALAHLGHREALPLIKGRVERARRDQEAVDANEFLRIVNALGILGGDKARRTLWKIFDSLSSHDRSWAGALIEALLNAAQPEDVNRVAQIYRSWPAGDRTERGLGAFASAVGAGRLAQEVGYTVQDGFDTMMERAEWWLGSEPVLSVECTSGLIRAFENGHKDTFRVVLREARHIIEQRGDDVDGWLEAWEAGDCPVGYRRRTSLTMLTLRAFAAHPHLHLDQRMRESGLGFALLCQLSLDCDDQARLDASEDQTETLLDILVENRDNLLPDITERVAALGPGIAPQLIERFDPEDFGWGSIRVAQAIERLARRYPGSCDAVAPVLVEAIRDDQGDFLLEAASGALEAIGAPAVPPMIERLRDDDVSRRIFLTYSLGQIPTESAARAILDLVADGSPVEEMHVTSLRDIGSPLAIEPLADLWESDHYLGGILAEALLVICGLNDVQRPELPEWRRAVEAEEARFARASAGFGSQIRLVGQPGPSLAEPASTRRKRGRRRRKKHKRE